MRKVFSFLLKEYAVFIIITLVSVFFGLYVGSFWNYISYIFLIFFLFEWNIQSKNNLTWFFLESSPLTLLQRFFIHFVFPFAFCFFIFLALKIHQVSAQFVVQPIYDSLRLSSIFVLSSLMARGIPSYFLQLIFLSLISYVISRFHFFEIGIFIFTVFASLYFISGRRLSPLKFVQIPLLVAVTLTFGGHFLRLPGYELMLKIPSVKTQNVLIQSMMNDQLLFENPKTTGFNLPHGHHVIRDPEDLFSLFVIDNRKLNDRAVASVEHVVLNRKKCDEYCLKLSSIVRRYPSQWNEGRYESYLLSQNVTQQTYVLTLLSRARRPIFLDRVAQLMASDNETVSEMAKYVLQRWGVDISRISKAGNVF